MISILMPIYNGIQFINDSVKSVLNQEYNEWELIIGINGHDKNSDVFKIAYKYEDIDKRIKVFDLYKLKGKSNSLNEMIKLTNPIYKWVAILDVDDIWLPHKLSSQIPYINRYDIIGTVCKYFGDLNSIPNIPIGDITQFNFLSYNPIINSSSLIKKELAYWDDCNLEDYELWLKLWKKGYKFFNVPNILVLHRIHKSSYFNNSNNKYVNDLVEKYSNK